MFRAIVKQKVQNVSSELDVNLKQLYSSIHLLDEATELWRLFSPSKFSYSKIDSFTDITPRGVKLSLVTKQSRGICDSHENFILGIGSNALKLCRPYIMVYTQIRPGFIDVHAFVDLFSNRFILKHLFYPLPTAHITAKAVQKRPQVASHTAAGRTGRLKSACNIACGKKLPRHAVGQA
jgi:hypothetical protein